MNLQQYTIKSQEAINKAVEIAMAHEQQSIETAHLLKAIIEVDENVVPFLFKKTNVNLAISHFAANAFTIILGIAISMNDVIDAIRLTCETSTHHVNHVAKVVI